MRILYAIESLGSGGTERSLAELLPPLTASGVEPEVVCLRRVEGCHEAVEAAGVPVTVLAARGWWSRIAELRRRLRRKPPDLLHTMLFRTDLIGRLAAAGTGVTVLGSLVSTPYDPVRRLDPRVRTGRLNRARRADAWTARRLCHHFHAVSRAAANAAVRDLGVPAERITVVPRGRDPRALGIPSPRRRAAARAVLGLEEEDELVVHSGRHEYAKGQLDLVAATALLARSRPRLRVLIAGREGALTADLEQAIAAGVTDRVRLLGHRDDVPELLAAADLFAFPSLYEGLPGAVIEAMALGLPVVAADIPPLREVVEPDRSALLVPPGEPAALASAIDDMLFDRERARTFGRRGRALFEERFTLERSLHGMLELYRSLTGSRRSAKATRAEEGA